jgi:guanine deaminase
MTPQQNFMKAAADLAMDSVRSGKGGPFGAVAVLDGQIIGRGQNLVPSLLDPTAHAEIVAIRQACAHVKNFHLTGVTLYSTCEPCPMCLSAALWARVECIYFSVTRTNAAECGFDDAVFYEQLQLPLEKRIICMKQVFPEMGSEPMQEWQRKPDRVMY